MAISVLKIFEKIHLNLDELLIYHVQRIWKEYFIMVWSYRKNGTLQQKHHSCNIFLSAIFDLPGALQKP